MHSPLTVKGTELIVQSLSTKKPVVSDGFSSNSYQKFKGQIILFLREEKLPHSFYETKK